MHLSPAATLTCQRTLKRRIHCVGTGLHSGAKVSLALLPAPADHGIVFHRTDLSGPEAMIPARWDHVIDTRLCTVIGTSAEARVGTIEHLMAALAACGVDNALIEVDGPEVPIMDGSSAPFLFLIACAGLEDLEAPRRVIRLTRPISVQDGDKTAMLEPADAQIFTASIRFDAEVIGHQTFALRLSQDRFNREVARARTFGFYEEVEMMRQMGLARGGSLDNAIVIRDGAVMNPEGTHWPDEFVRHKVLDAVGDIALAGAPILAKYAAHKPGHDMNNRLLRALFAAEDAIAWDVVAEPPQATRLSA